jgi:hypothetical protein
MQRKWIYSVDHYWHKTIRGVAMGGKYYKDLNGELSSTPTYSAKLTACLCGMARHFKTDATAKVVLCYGIPRVEPRKFCHFIDIVYRWRVYYLVGTQTTTQIIALMAYVPISAYTQKRLYRKAPLPKSAYTDKRVYPKALHKTSFRVKWPRFRSDNPNLTLV